MGSYKLQAPKIKGIPTMTRHSFSGPLSSDTAVGPVGFGSVGNCEDAVRKRWWKPVENCSAFAVPAPPYDPNKSWLVFHIS